MRSWPYILIIVGMLAAAFGYWGINTVAGRRAYDEMAGMIPLAVGVLGLASIIAGAVWLFLRSR